MGEGRQNTDRNNMVSMDFSNINIPHGTIRDDEELLFDHEHTDGTKITYHYRYFFMQNIKDARRICKSYGMALPEPRNAAFNVALATLR